jgi:hypothetical protein
LDVRSRICGEPGVVVGGWDRKTLESPDGLSLSNGTTIRLYVCETGASPHTSNFEMIRLGRLKATSLDIRNHDVRSVSKGFRSQMPHASKHRNKWWL